MCEIRSGKILSSREKRRLSALLKEQWGIDVPKEMREQVWFLNNKEKVFLCTRDIARLPFDWLRIERLGIYIAKLHRGELRLSVEGSQLLGPLAKKNIVGLNDNEAHLWLQGEEIEKSVKRAEPRAFVLIKHNVDFLGCGTLADDNNNNNSRILNFVPKARRLRPTAEPF